MKRFFRIIVTTLLALIVSVVAPAQTANQKAIDKKLSVGTKMAIANRKANKPTEKAVRQAFLKQNQLKIPSVRSPRTKSMSLGGTTSLMESAGLSDLDDSPETFAEPFTQNGVQMVQCWVKLTDNNTAALSSISGVKVTATFDHLLTANIPVDKLETVAALGNVEKVSVATMLKPTTYYAREASNVDDVLNYTADAQAAGLLQAYDGTGVVIGIIDTGIQFDHAMFKDGSGNTRIKKAIVYDSTAGELKEYTGSAISSLTYDRNTTSHGTHTSTIAGGSNITINGTYYDKYTSSKVDGERTYGGMAPGADLFLCGLGNSATNANIAYCIQKICEYADAEGKPCVISISLGTQNGPHDGTGYMADVCKQYITGAGKVLFRAAGNDAGDNIYHCGNASYSSPAMTLLNLTYNDGNTSTSGGTTYTYYNYDLYGQVVTYARTPGTELAAKFYVVDTRTNTIVWVSDEMTSDTKWTVRTNDTSNTYSSTLAQYFSSSATSYGGQLSATFSTNEYNGKTEIYTNAYYLRSKGTTTDGTTITGYYQIGISVYPKNSGESTYIDSWGLNSTYFDGATATYSGTNYEFTEGSDLCSITDGATNPYVISVGSYCTMRDWVNSAGSSYYVKKVILDEVSYFSGYAAEGYGPLGTKMPWITAPGAMIIAGYNNYYSGNSATRIISDTDSPLGVNSGTSMAAPCAAGIVALWLQVDPTLTLEDIKALMAKTAITDTYTASAQFGPNGKIDALAGIKELLPSTPQIGATPQSVTLSATTGETVTQTITVRGANLTDAVTATLNDPTGFYSIDKTSITAATAQTTDGETITVTYKPTAEGTHTATITLASSGADDVVVTLNGAAEDKPEYVYVLTNTLTAGEEYLIVSRNTAGSGYALGHSGTSVASDAVTVKSNTDVADAVYIEESDVDATSKWTVATGYTFKNGSYYVGYSWGSLTISTSSTNWTWSGTNNRLYYSGWSTYYLRYSSNNFTVSTTAGSIYLYKKTQKKKTAKITANPTTVNIEAYVNESGTGSFTVSGTGLKGDISATLADANGVFSLSSTTITASEAASGKEITVTFAPTATGTYSGTVTLASTGATSVTVNLNGTAVKPELIATPSELTFEASPGETNVQTFGVLGSSLKGDVSITLTDPSDVFTLNKTSLTKAEAEAGEDISVTFSPSALGTYTGTITLSSEGVEDVVEVALTATPSYWPVEISKYGLTTLYLDFPVQIPYDTYDLDLLGVYYVYSTDDTKGEARLYSVGDYIPARTAVIVQGNAGTYRFPKTSISVPAIEGNQLRGTLESISTADALAAAGATDGKIMTLGLGSNGYIGFYRYSGTMLVANKGYLVYTGTAPSLTIGSGQTTGITSPSSALPKGRESGLYTLDGRKINLSPEGGVGGGLPRGVYISNGKKLIVK